MLGVLEKVELLKEPLLTILSCSDSTGRIPSQPETRLLLCEEAALD